MRPYLKLRRSTLFKDDTFYFEVTKNIFGFIAGDVFGELFNHRELAERWLETNIL